MKKQKVAQALIAAALVMVPATAAQASPLLSTATDACTGISVNTTTDVNLRSKASATASIVGVVKNGSTMNVLDCNGGASWWHVSYGKNTGYVASRYTVELGNVDVSTGPIAVPQPEPVCPQESLWTTQGVNMRAAASATSKIKTVLQGGTNVTLLDCAGNPGWKHVAYQGTQGFVASRYLVGELSDQ